MPNFAKLLSGSRASHYLGIIIWITPLLILNNGENSLMPYDEAVYAVRARWMLESGDWLTPQSWGELVYEKTPGPYWWLAFVYKVFGISEVTSRLPAQIACIVSLLVIYEITVMLLNKRIAYLASSILGVSFLWLQSSRLANANLMTICIAFLGLCCLLKAELNPKYRYYWSFFAGLSFALGLLIRGQLIFVLLIALVPYLIWKNQRHRLLCNSMLYVGFIIGLIPTFAWFLLSWLRYGSVVFEQFFGLAFRIALEQRNGNSFLFYLWNTPIKAFPWAFFSILGLIIVSKRPVNSNHWILIVCPLVILTEISLVSTRLPHYALMLYPFMAILAAVAFDWLGEIYNNNLNIRKFRFIPRNLSYLFGGLGGLIFIAGIVLYTGILPINFEQNINIKNYAIIGLVLGVSWLTLPLIWTVRHRFGKKFLTAKYWIASWLLSAWLGLAVAGATGLFSNYNPDIKVFLQQRAIASALQNNSIHFVVQQTDALTTGGNEALLLLTFYTPHWGKRFKQVLEVPTGSYAWVSPEPSVGLSTAYRHLGTFRGWKLIQLVKEGAGTE
ncbi:glycosyl transferase family protein [Nostoc sp. NIES-4103]|nr:glycosyl transferase family protein [Nostoc sp. NIES-4103]